MVRSFVFLSTIFCLVQLSALDCVHAQQGRIGRASVYAWRFFGHGYSRGYNAGKPMVDPSYYNPYSAHNSTLISRDPAYIQSGIQSTDLLSGRKFHQGVPFSVYAAPPNQPKQFNAPNGGVDWSNRGEAIDSSFEPYEKEFDNEDSDSDVDQEDNAMDSKESTLPSNQELDELDELEEDGNLEEIEPATEVQDTKKGTDPDGKTVLQYRYPKGKSMKTHATQISYQLKPVTSASAGWQPTLQLNTPQQNLTDETLNLPPFGERNK